MKVKTILCPKCRKPMTYAGNETGIVYTSYPEQWDDTWVCHDCKVKHHERAIAELPPDDSDYRAVSSGNDTANALPASVMRTVSPWRVT